MLKKIIYLGFVILFIFQLIGCYKPMKSVVFEIVYENKFKQTLIYICEKDKIRFKNGCLILDEKPVKCEILSYKIVDISK